MNRKQFFDQHAAGWDALLTPERRAAVRRAVGKLGLKRGESVLDVGGGTGVILPLIRRAVGPSVRVDLLDFSKKMLAEARRKFGGEFGYLAANAEKIPVPSGRYDAVVCFNVFPHFVRRIVILKELRRVLKKGGRILIAHSASADEVNKHHHHVGGPVIRDFLPGKSRMEALLKTAGFSEVVVRDLGAPYLAMGRT